MTEKQETILQSALELFSKEGFHATSTNKVAKHAGVSEGLIFRHFENKAGLLEAILKKAEDKFKMNYANIVFESDPKEKIRKTILLPFQIEKKDYEFWRLIMKLKWEMGHNSEEKLKPLIQAVASAFEELGNSNPELEAQLLIQTMDGIGASLLRDSVEDKEGLKKLILNKYGY